jgi:hypothetical protein
MQSYLGTTPFEFIKIGTDNIESIAYPLEGETLAFISASGITSEVEIGAVNYLVYRLKEENLFNEFYNLYPFVGSTSLSNSINLINTTQYTINFQGNWIYDSNGITANGVDTQANTLFNPGTSTPSYNPSAQTFNLSNSYHLYNRTLGTTTDGDFGGIFSLGQNILAIKTSTADSYYTFSRYATTNWAASATLGANEELGLFTGNINNSVPTSKGLFRNGIQIAQNTGTTLTGTLGISAVRLLGAVETNFTNRNYALAAIGNGFADVSRLKVFYDIVQTYQTILGRQV